jgi:hypothetical protein
VPVHLPTGLLRRHLLAVAKTRTGKSTLLLRLVHHLMDSGSDHRCVVLVDPHRDLAVSALGLVPRARQGDVVYLDVANRRRPFGINLLDTGLGWDRDQATATALRIFRREFDGYWGPRMEDAFRFATLRCTKPTKRCAPRIRVADAAHSTPSNTIECDQLDAKWNVDGPSLLAKLRELTTAQCLALADAAARFWGQPEQDTDASLHDIGLLHPRPDPDCVECTARRLGAPDRRNLA